MWRGERARNWVVRDPSKDENLTDFGKSVLRDRYLLPGEEYQDIFARVASYYADTPEHAQRLYNYMADLWFLPATPVLTNGGTDRGLPISCFLNEADDSLESIVDIWTENVWLAARGGGIGTYWGNLRSVGERIGECGKTSGIMPFVRVMDSLTLAISQGSLRRGNAAIYLPVDHPEIEEFVELRKPTGGDPNRKTPNLHHGVMISDAFMQAVEKDLEWDLISPKTKQVIRTISARQLWIRILTTRVETGEPYIVFSDTVNRACPDVYKKLGLSVKMSNLCSEIVLHTGKDHLGEARTAVCCLSSLNLEYFHDWKTHPDFIPDVMRFLDNVLEDFIQKAPDSMAKAKYSAMRERSVGLGVMGFHSFLQKQSVPMESVVALVWNKKIFRHISDQVNQASKDLAEKYGPCPDAIDAGLMERFSNKTAIAPTASISILCGGTSPGVEPVAANVFMHKTLSGSYPVRNPYLHAILKERGQDTEEVWTSITVHEGSVQHLDFLTQDEKDTFKTAFEIDQRWLIELAADRTPFITQAQSVNVFLPADVHKKDLHQLHYQAWKRGVKSLYYLRSKALQRAEVVARPDSHNVVGFLNRPAEEQVVVENKYEECLACQ